REGVAGPEELALWDDGYVREGAVVIAGRANAVRRLATLAEAAHAELSGAAGEALSLAYEAQLGDEWRRLLPSEPTAATVPPLLPAAPPPPRRRGAAAGGPRAGPRRDAGAKRGAGAGAPAVGARPQLRPGARARRRGEARPPPPRAAPPVLLLDDIVSELDE